MKNFTSTPIALAILALATTPAFASNNEGGDNHHQPTSSASAVVADGQISTQNSVTNTLSTNNSSLSGNVLNKAAGNIGVNVATGDNNQQANAAAISAADASFVFGSTDAHIAAFQQASQNYTSNNGHTNLAGMSGDVMSNVAGNIGVNMAAGNSNQQKNDLAIATGTSTNGSASVGVMQMNANNSTTNAPVQHQEVQYIPVNLTLNASGSYYGYGSGGYSGSNSGYYYGSQSGDTSGTSYQASNIYPDTWSGSSHPGGTSTGHIDIDSQTQGAVQNPAKPGVGGLAFDNTGTYSGSQSGYYYGGQSGGLGFQEAGYQALQGTVSGMLPVVITTNVNTTNTASLTDNVLASASGNIGVNIAAGTNNQQYNGLAVASISAPK